MKKLDVKEIHGYRSELGLKVFTTAAIDQHMLTHNISQQ